MSEKIFSPGEIREYLDLSRSALRYYISKGLLDVAKDDDNGYHAFTQRNLSDLRDISYLRQTLGFSVTDIKDCFDAQTPEDYQEVFIRRRKELDAEISRLELQRDRLSGWGRYLFHLQNMPDTIDVVEFTEPFLFSATLSPTLDKLSFPSTSFSLSEDGEPAFSGYGYCFNEPDHLDEQVLSHYILFPKGRYIYSMCRSEHEINDPAILQPSLRWAEEHGYRIRGPIQVNTFFHMHKGTSRLHYYDVTIPFAECDVKTLKISAT